MLLLPLQSDDLEVNKFVKNIHGVHLRSLSNFPVLEQVTRVGEPQSHCCFPCLSFLPFNEGVVEHTLKVQSHNHFFFVKVTIDSVGLQKGMI